MAELKPCVLLSIKPKWCELIASGKKTVEIRKTKPKIKTPFKCYIYCTKQNVPGEILLTYNKKVEWRNKGFRDDGDISLAGKVIGEFICNEIYCRTLCNLVIKEDAEHTLKGTCLTREQVLDYLGYQYGTNIYDCNNSDFYRWHISHLVIYDTPKDLKEFKKPCNETNLCYPDNCNRCGWNILLRPPQSWCYVEELES